MFDPDPEYAQQLDAADPLAGYRDQFVIADPDIIYLDGNSLGRLPSAAQQLLQDVVVYQWGERLIRGWNDGWITAPRRVGDKIAALIGAEPGEVLVGDSTSINLFKLAVAALRARAGRTKIITDALNFPSDLYILQGAVDLLGSAYSLSVVPSHDGVQIEAEDLVAELDHVTALLALTHVAFKSAFMYDIAALTERAHAAGALALWDLSHSVGAVPLRLNDWNVDLAVGCTYKYLNGGPGAPAFLYVRRSLQKELLSPIWGWMGSDTPFAFDLDYSPSSGIERFWAGTPPMISLLAIEPALDLMIEAGIENLRRKSVAQTAYLLELVRVWLLPLGFTIGSPLDPEQRGSHISLQHPDAYRISQAMIDPERNDGEMSHQPVVVIPDFRAPDNIRLGITPLYTTFSEIHHAIARIRSIVESQEFMSRSHKRPKVT